jgi:ATP-grasp ribosomal peptide maturase
MSGVVLVLTCLEDPTADMVIGHLNAGGARVARLDPGIDFPATVSFSTGFEARPYGSVKTSSRHFSLDEVCAVYYRRPTPYMTDPPSQVERFAATQARFGLGGTLASLPCRYVNHPWKVMAAEHKPLQLRTAHQVGFSLPPTLITNRPSDARAFAVEHRRTIYKPLRFTPCMSPAGEPSTIWATPVDPGSIDHTIAHTAHLFQARVDKAADLRMTVVGKRVFCVRIESDLLDWRQDYDRIAYTVVDPPPRLADTAFAFLRALDLSFGAFDFAITRDGSQVFLECNPNGQWGWLEDATGIPVAAAIAELLLEAPR